MALQDAQVQGKEMVMQMFEALAPTPYYSVWKGGTIVFPWNDDDKEAGVEYFEKNLSAFAMSKNRDILLIKWHPEKADGFITDKTPVIASLSFRATEHDPQSYRMSGAEFRESRVNDELAKAVNLLTAKLSAQDAAGDGDEEDEEAMIGSAERLMTQADKLLNNPTVNLLLSRMFGMPQNNTAPIALAGPPQTSPLSEQDQAAQNQLLATALQNLMQYDPMPQLAQDLQKLADLAAKDRAQFNFLIGMLRKM